MGDPETKTILTKVRTRDSRDGYPNLLNFHFLVRF